MHEEAEFHRNIASATSLVDRGEPMISVRDMRQTVRWYASIGFTIQDDYEEGSDLVFARASFGGAVFALSPGADAGLRDVRFWLYTSDAVRLYEIFRKAGRSDIRFEEHVYEPFYGGRQFSISDINGLHLIFYQRVADR